MERAHEALTFHPPAVSKVSPEMLAEGAEDHQLALRRAERSEVLTEVPKGDRSLRSELCGPSHLEPPAKCLNRRKCTPRMLAGGERRVADSFIQDRHAVLPPPGPD